MSTSSSVEISNPETKDSSSTSSHHQRHIFNGHDYTDAQFEEMNQDRKDTLIALPRVTGSWELVNMTNKGGPGAKYNGLGWRDLFARPTKWDRLRWASLGDLRYQGKIDPLNEGFMFRVWFCPPGLVHVEVDDEGTWTVQDVLALPEWMFIG